MSGCSKAEKEMFNSNDSSSEPAEGVYGTNSERGKWTDRCLTLV